MRLTKTHRLTRVANNQLLGLGPVDVRLLHPVRRCRLLVLVLALVLLVQQIGAIVGGTTYATTTGGVGAAFGWRREGGRRRGEPRHVADAIAEEFAVDLLMGWRQPLQSDRVGADIVRAHYGGLAIGHCKYTIDDNDNKVAYDKIRAEKMDG